MVQLCNYGGCPGISKWPLSSLPLCRSRILQDRLYQPICIASSGVGTNPVCSSSAVGVRPMPRLTGSLLLQTAEAYSRKIYLVCRAHILHYCRHLCPSWQVVKISVAIRSRASTVQACRRGNDSRRLEAPITDREPWSVRKHLVVRIQIRVKIRVMRVYVEAIKCCTEVHHSTRANEQENKYYTA